MAQFKATEEMLAALMPLTERVEVVDHRGALVGFFIPAQDATDLLRSKAFAEYDAEKARRRRENPQGGFTTEQLLAHLRSLDNR